MGARKIDSRERVTSASTDTEKTRSKTGGDVAIRGFIIQTLSGILDALDESNTHAWTAVTFEPKGDFVDVEWRYKDGSIGLEQVKSTVEVFKPSDLKEWIRRLKESPSGKTERIARRILTLAGPNRFSRQQLTDPIVEFKVLSEDVDTLHALTVARLMEYRDKQGFAPCGWRSYWSTVNSLFYTAQHKSTDLYDVGHKTWTRHDFETLISDLLRHSTDASTRPDDFQAFEAYNQRLKDQVKALLLPGDESAIHLYGNLPEMAPSFVDRRVRRRTHNRQSTCESLTVSELATRLGSTSHIAHISLVGNPGTGKTAFLRHFCHTLAAQWSFQAWKENTCRLPIFISLRHFSSYPVLKYSPQFDAPFRDWIAATLKLPNLMAAPGPCLFIFDALDEVEGGDRSGLDMDFYRGLMHLIGCLGTEGHSTLISTRTATIESGWYNTRNETFRPAESTDSEDAATSFSNGQYELVPWTVSDSETAVKCAFSQRPRLLQSILRVMEDSPRRRGIGDASPLAVGLLCVAYREQQDCDIEVPLGLYEIQALTLRQILHSRLTRDKSAPDAKSYLDKTMEFLGKVAHSITTQGEDQSPTEWHLTRSEFDQIRSVPADDAMQSQSAIARSSPDGDTILRMSGLLRLIHAPEVVGGSEPGPRVDAVCFIEARTLEFFVAHWIAQHDDQEILRALENLPFRFRPFVLELLASRKETALAIFKWALNYGLNAPANLRRLQSQRRFPIELTAILRGVDFSNSPSAEWSHHAVLLGQSILRLVIGVDYFGLSAFRFIDFKTTPRISSRVLYELVSELWRSNPPIHHHPHVARWRELDEQPESHWSLVDKIGIYRRDMTVGAWSEFGSLMQNVSSTILWSSNTILEDRVVYQLLCESDEEVYKAYDLRLVGAVVLGLMMRTSVLYTAISPIALYPWYFRVLEGFVYRIVEEDERRTTAEAECLSTQKVEVVKWCQTLMALLPFESMFPRIEVNKVWQTKTGGLPGDCIIPWCLERFQIMYLPSACVWVFSRDGAWSGRALAMLRDWILAVSHHVQWRTPPLEAFSLVCRHLQDVEGEAFARWIMSMWGGSMYERERRQVFDDNYSSP